MPVSVGDRLGPYEILEPIGKGGMGEVWKARDTRVNREVAIKFSQAQFTDRFEREANAIASLNHPNICTLFDVGPNYLVMELIDGPTLADRIKEGPIPLDESLTIARQIADALDAAHEKNIVHRDLKPGNVKIKPDGSVKVLDFGLAKSGFTETTVTHDSPTLMQSPTQYGVILGTAAYMAPEQARGKTIDKRADIWSFGVVLYEMLTGKRLFEGEDLTETLAAVVKSDPNLAPIPRKLRRLIAKCLEKHPRNRLRDIADWQELIETEIPSSGSAPPPTQQATSRQRVFPVATGVLAVALAGLAFVHFRQTPPEQRTVRFQIPAPEKASFQFFSISPDGRNLVFNANHQLWIRALDSLAVRPLPGTEGIYAASLGSFWSPDSRFIAFVNQGKLQKLAISGGPAQVLCDVINFTGGSWSTDGIILIGQFPSLFRVPEAGGVPVQVPKTAETLQLSPEFLPDGRHFFYRAISGKDGEEGIFVGSLDGAPAVRLIGAATNVSYAPHDQSGYLLFMRGETLMAQPFDSTRRRLGGAQFPVAEPVGQLLGFGFFSVSQNGTLVYAPSARSVEAQLAWKDRSGKFVENFGPPGNYNDFRLSPDEKRIAFDRSQSGNTDVWVLDSTRRSASRLTFDPATDNIPMWSPDGQRIIWPSSRSGIGFDLYIKSANGTGPENLLVKMGTRTGWASDWSTDGRFILYQISGANTGQDLWIAPQHPEGASEDGKPYPYLQSQFDEKDGRFSPNGKWVAYVSNESGRDEIYVQSFPLSGAKFQISTNGGAEPQWRKDGAELFYVGADEMLMAVPVKPESKAGDAFQTELPKPLFSVSAQLGAGLLARDYAVSNDGQRFLVRGEASGIAPPLTVVLNWQADSQR